MRDLHDSALLLAPELASQDWSNLRDAADLVSRYDELILTALLLGRPMIMPAACLDTLERQVTIGTWGAAEAAIKVRDSVYLLRDEGCLTINEFSEDVEWALRMASADLDAASAKGITFPGSKSIWAKLPGPDTECVLTAGHSGLYQNLAAVANFALLAQQGYGAEHLQLTAISRFDFQRFLAIKAFIWDVVPPAASSSLVQARDVLSFYLPLGANRRSLLELQLLRQLVRLRKNYEGALDEWRSGIETLRQGAVEEYHDARKLLLELPIPVQRALEHELRAFTKEMTFSGVALMLLTIAHKPIGMLLEKALSILPEQATSVLPKALVLGRETLHMSHIRSELPFFFWLERAKAAIEDYQGHSAAVLPKTEQSHSTEMMWVNRHTKVYHRKGARYYGTTKRGQWMTETDAIAAGCRPSKMPDEK
jgi:hypothetical protein